jgi:hypothetical protein
VGKEENGGAGSCIFLFFIIIFAVPPRGRLTAKVVEPTVYVAGTVSHLFFFCRPLGLMHGKRLSSCVRKAHGKYPLPCKTLLCGLCCAFP